MNTSISLSTLVKDIKVSSSKFINNDKIYPNFKGWQEGYGAFTYNIKEKDRLINYIKNQEEHHKIITFEDGYRKLLHENGVEFEEKYLL